MQDEITNDQSLKQSQSCENHTQEQEDFAGDFANADSAQAVDSGLTEQEEQKADSSESNESSASAQRAQELEDKYMRAYADFENVKKRLEREKNQALEYAYEKIARDLLPVLDALDSAKEAAKEHEAIAQGIKLTQESFLKALQKHGIESIATDGEFDPNVHECIMQVAKPEAQDGHIAQVMQRGYKYKERTLRPAMVAVVKND